MACGHSQMWSLSGLVAAFLDLWIAYILLCASALVYTLSRFMGFFGLNFPCACNGIFCNITSRSLCLNRLLVDIPTQKVADVQLSVDQKFPFCNSAIHEQRKGNELKYEASCSCLADTDPKVTEKFDKKGKKFRHQSRSRSSVIRNHGHAPDAGVDTASVPYEESSDSPRYSSEEDLRMKRQYKSMRDDLGRCSGDEKNAYKLSEQELDAECGAHAAVYAELEKERSAAASAAEEAMAMILRLQEEKASLYMKARQSERMAEERYAYDAEEISILKEILVRTEKEKHVLEKELEAYRQMTFTDGDAFDSHHLSPPLFDPISFLHGNSCSPCNEDAKFSARQRYIDEKSEGMPSFNSGGFDLHEKEIISIDNPFNHTSEKLEECSLVQGEKIIETCSGSLCSYPSSKHAQYYHSDLGDANVNESRRHLAALEPCIPITVASEASTNNSETAHDLPPVASNILTSSLDRKILEINGEVELLQERLKLIQMGKEKLRFGETRAHDNDGNMMVFQAIRATDHERAIRQMSLPLNSTKVHSRKRRSQSVSSESISIL